MCRERGTRLRSEVEAVTRNPMKLDLAYDLEPSTWLIMRIVIRNREVNGLDVTVVPVVQCPSSAVAGATTVSNQRSTARPCALQLCADQRDAILLNIQRSGTFAPDLRRGSGRRREQKEVGRA